MAEGLVSGLQVVDFVPQPARHVRLASRGHLDESGRLALEFDLFGVDEIKARAVSQENVAAAINDIRPMVKELRILGSYPAAVL